MWSIVEVVDCPGSMVPMGRSQGQASVLAATGHVKRFGNAHQIPSSAISSLPSYRASRQLSSKSLLLVCGAHSGVGLLRATGLLSFAVAAVDSCILLPL